MYSYLPMEALKLRLDITDATDDTTVRQVLEAASREVDGRCGGRRFQPYTATMVYTADDAYELEVDDLLSVTSIATLASNTTAGRAYGSAWATTGYDLEPGNAPALREPYTSILSNLETFPLDRRGVQIVGRWGYWSQTEASGATLGDSLSDSATTVTVSSGPAFQRLQTILIGTEDMYVTRIVDNTLTVVRGVNGTTAASHSSGGVIHIYRYPEPVVEATELFAARQFRRADAPLGVAGTDALGTAQRISTREGDAIAKLAPFRRVRGVAVRG